MRVRINDSDRRAIQRLFADTSRESKKILTNALNKTLTNVKTFAAKKVGEEISLKASRIKQDMKPIRANYGNIEASLDTKSLPPGWYSFTGTIEKKGKGVSAKIFKKAPRKMMEGAFIAKVKYKSGKSAKHVFRRQYRKRHEPKPIDPNLVYGALPKKYRMKLDRMHGPRVATIVEKKHEEIGEFGAERIGINLANEYDRVLRGF